ncbi:MAG: carboxypeptidase regulatory-like domain-containing protein [Bacteroidota bacterium]
MFRLPLLLAALALIVSPSVAQTGTAEVTLFPVTFTFNTVPGSTDGPELVGLGVDFYEAGSGTLAFSTTVGPDSTVIVEDAPVGTYIALLAPNANWTNALTFSPVNVSEGGGSPGFLLIAPVGDGDGLVSGQITDADTGDPVPFLIGFATSSCDVLNSSCTGISQIFIADADGRYGFAAEPGDYDLTLFFLPDFLGIGFAPTLLYNPAEVSISTTAGQTTSLDLALDARGTGFLSGTVTDPSGAPAAGVPVELVSTDNLYFAEVTTGADGGFNAEVPEADYLVRARGSSIGALDVFFGGTLNSTDATPVTVNEDETTSGIDIALQAVPSSLTATVQGIVRDASGTPLDGITVGMYNWAENFFIPVAEATSGPDGSYEITYSSLALLNAPLLIGVVEEDYEWQFYDGKPTFSVADFLWVGSSDATFTGIDFALIPEGSDGTGFSISGTVSDETIGAPVGQALVAAVNLEDGRISYGVSDPSGAYRVSGLSEGDHVVLFTKEEYVPAFWPDAQTWTTASAVEVASNVQGINARIGGLNRPVRGRGPIVGGNLQGIVRDVDGTPLAGALVTARSGEDVVGFALTDSQGSYALDSLPPSVVNVQVDLPRYAVADQPTSMYSGSGVLSFELSPQSVVSNETTRTEETGTLQVFPNPTRGVAQAAFVLEASGPVRVSVYDALGREVAVVADRSLAAGAHQIPVRAALAPGLYVLRLETAAGAQVQRFVVAR